jgi:hypothetical protein
LQVNPHAPLTQVAAALGMAGQTVQLVPHAAGEVSDTHTPLQTCCPDAQPTTQRPASQAVRAPAAVGQVTHAAPQRVTSSSRTHAPPQAW